MLTNIPVWAVLAASLLIPTTTTPVEENKPTAPVESVTTTPDITAPVVASPEAKVSFERVQVKSTPAPPPPPPPPAPAVEEPPTPVVAAQATKTQTAPAAKTATSAPAAAPAVRAVPVSPGSAQAEAASQIQGYGWGPEQLNCLINLWEKESNWNSTAENPSSGAYGIPQSLPGTKMASAGADWRTNPATQIKWGLGYISERYKTPCGAWQHSVAVGWY